MRLNSMEQFARAPDGWNPIIPTPGDMHGRIKKQDTIAEWITASKIVEEPAIHGTIFAKRSLDGRNSLLMRRSHDERHLIRGVA